ncbi:hypothetical protein C0991_006776 [Blastosporella zonata]|nr:hypothetical protein C0991_006776 [Blastosporella zonata]
MSVDSYFWGQPYLWPEFAGIYFNVYQGKSAEWGTSPRFAYWTSHLPKLLMSSLPLAVVGFLQDQRIRTLLFPFLMFIGLISCLGHKEWRFIIYVVPIFNIAAANGLRYLTTTSKRTTLGKLFALSYMPFFLSLNIALTCILTLTSMHNYPGGEALALMHQLYPPYHIRPSPPWTYDKTENLTITDLTANQTFTHLIVEERPNEETRRHWEVVASVEGFERWNVDRGVVRTLWRDKTIHGMRDALFGVLIMSKEEKLWILHRKANLKS